MPNARDLMPQWQQLSHEAIFHKHHGNIQLAIEFQRKCIDVLRGVPTLISEAAIKLNYLADLYLLNRDAEHAEDAIRESVAINRSIDSPFLSSDLLILARILWQKGRCGEALQTAEEALQVSQRMGNAHDIEIANQTINEIKGLAARRTERVRQR